LVTEPTRRPVASPDVLKVLRRKVHQTLKQVTKDFEQFEFNTIVSSLMELLNEMYKAKEAGAVGAPEWNEAVDIYLRMLAPVCPHIAEQLWSDLGKPYSIHTQAWPKLDEAATREDEITIPVQVNGKLRDRLVFPADATEEEIRSAVLASGTIRKFLEGKTPKKVIVVQKKLVSIVV
jgi:leucyl-tRNA synthetase